MAEYEATSCSWIPLKEVRNYYSERRGPDCSQELLFLLVKELTGRQACFPFETGVEHGPGVKTALLSLAAQFPLYASESRQAL